jgi:hypothetical protein
MNKKNTLKRELSEQDPVQQLRTLGNRKHMEQSAMEAKIGMVASYFIHLSLLTDMMDYDTAAIDGAYREFGVSLRFNDKQLFRKLKECAERLRRSFFDELFRQSGATEQQAERWQSVAPIISEKLLYLTYLIMSKTTLGDDANDDLVKIIAMIQNSFPDKSDMDMSKLQKDLL